MAAEEPQTTARIADTIPLHDGRPAIVSMAAIIRQNLPGSKARARAEKAALDKRDVAILTARERKAAAADRDERKLGRRKQRRWENATFHGAQHITAPRVADYSPCQLNSSRNTFPAPPPSLFHPIKPSDPADATTAVSNVFDDTRAADYGRFSLPMRGMKRSLRKVVSTGGAGQDIVETVDRQLRHWLEAPEVYLNPDIGTSVPKGSNKVILDIDPVDSGTSEGEMFEPRPPTILQVSQQPHSLVWRVEDSFVRYLVHSVARYYRVVTFTKLSSSQHLVYLLRPNVQSKRTVDPFVKLSLDTPPTTEWEASSALEGSTTDVSTALEGTEDSASEQMTEGEDDWDVVSEVASATGYEVDEDTTITEIAVARHVRPARTTRTDHRFRTNLSDIDSGAEVDDEQDSDAGSLESSMADLSIQPTAHRRTGRPVNSVVYPIISPDLRDESLERAILDASPVIPPMVDRHARETFRLARNSRDRTKAGWRMPEETFLEWIAEKHD